MCIRDRFQAFNKIFVPTGLNISGIKLSDRGSWELEIDDSIKITVGRTRLSDRIKRFIKLYEKSNLKANFDNSEVDLRYENGVAVKNADIEMSKLAFR